MFCAQLPSHSRLGLHSMMKTWSSGVWKPNLTRTPKSSFSCKSLPSRGSFAPRIFCSTESMLDKTLLNGQSNGYKRTFLVCKRFSGQFSKAEVTRDVLLYKNDKGQFFKVVGVFAFAQLVFWMYLTHTAYLTMRDTDTYVKVKYGEEGPPDDVRNWRTWSGARMQLNSGIWRYAITLLCIGAGSIIFIGSFLYSRKSIYRIVLRKGGEDITIQTYGLFSLPWRFTTSLNHISCEHARHGVRTQLPVKVKGHRFFYILDKDGKFYNARLFDHTVGVHRMI